MPPGWTGRRQAGRRGTPGGRATLTARPPPPVKVAPPGSVNTPWPPCMCVSGQQRSNPVSRAHSVLSMCYTSSLKPILGDPTPQAYNQSWGTPHPTSTTNPGAPLTLHLQPILGTPHHTFTTNPGGNKTPAYNQSWGALSTPSPGEYAGAPGSYMPLRVKYADTGGGWGSCEPPQAAIPRPDPDPDHMTLLRG